MSDDLPCSIGDRQRHLSHYDFHHGEMFEVIVRLEQGVASVEFDKYTADGEQVTRKRPAETCREG